MRKKEKDKIKVGRYDRTDFYGVCVCETGPDWQKIWRCQLRVKQEAFRGWWRQRDKSKKAFSLFSLF